MRAGYLAFGRSTGVVQGTISFSNGDMTLTLSPTLPFAVGEEVLAVLSHNLEGTDGCSLRQAGYSFLFTTKTERAGLT